MLKLYSVFHLNLAYSSISESKRKEVIERCFWPLLSLATESRVPLAIELSGYTLEVASQLDAGWTEELRKAVRSGSVELVGAGYAQLIGPLVPAEINVWNLELGEEIYRSLLGVTPRVWYVNEQSYSAGIVEDYVSIGARAIIMEWNNPRTLHQEWSDEYRYYPQVAAGTNGSRIPVIWNDSISFQKFQRYAHGDIETSDLLAYLATHLSEKGRYHCLYGNDAEIFDFRPGRFKTEPELERPIEWSRIASLYGRLQSDPRFQLIFPSDVLKSPPVPSASYLPLSLESAVQPITVKKQPKYNVTRWSVTGRNSLYANTLCHRLYQRIKSKSTTGSPADREIQAIRKRLCYLWSSDFRTHITAERWDSFVAEAEGMLRETEHVNTSEQKSRPHSLTIALNGLGATLFLAGQKARVNRSVSSARTCEISGDESFLRISTPFVAAVFNLKRGLAIQSLIFPKLHPGALAGTIQHGYFEDIALSADWYTGNTVLQRPGKSQVTDLAPANVETMAGSNDGEAWLAVSTVIPTEAGAVKKLFKVYKSRPQIDLDYRFQWSTIPAGSFKTAFITLIPESYDLPSLFFATHNGGSTLEVFKLHGQSVAHNAPASSVVTASSGLGATEGIVIIGDARKALAIRFDPSVCASMPMVAFRESAPSFFARIMFSCGELDESRTEEVPGPLRFSCSIAGMGRQ
jgi:hypothetical protein